MTYEILEANFPRLKKQLTKIKNKCLKYGCDFEYKEVGVVYKPVVQHGMTIDAKYIVVEVDGMAIINDWEFAGVIEHLPSGNIVKSAGARYIPPHFATAPCMCEHCNSIRDRKDTYIVHNVVTDEFKQVGKSCLKDFTHGLSAEMAARYISLFDTLIQGEAPYEGVHIPPQYELNELLLIIAETIRKFGYRKSEEYSEGTAGMSVSFYNTIHGWYGPQKIAYHKERMDKVGFDAYADENRILIDCVKQWINDQSSDNMYFHNLQTLLKEEYVTSSRASILASAFPAYQKAIEKIKEEEEELAKCGESEYVGKIDDKIEVIVKEFDLLTGWATDFGDVYLYRFISNDNNIFIWKTSKSLPEKITKIKGTVRDHSEYRGKKQTVLTRCRVIE